MQQYPSAAPGRTWQQLAALAKTSPAVDYALVEALRARTDLPRTARVAIESLHGVNGFPADAWKDYYLEFQDRIDAQLHGTGKKGLNGTHPNTKATTPVDLKVKTESRSRAPAAAGGKSATVKRPKVVVPSPSVSSESSESESESDASPAVRSKRKRPASPKNKIRIKREASTPTLSKPPAAPSGSAPPARRATFNSLVSQLDAPPEDWNIPVPSRSPTPPNMETIIPADRGKRQANKFTDQDRQYVIKFLTYELHKDPDASKGELADKIGDKAPHHPARSWQSYFNRDDLIDKIRNLVPSSDEDAEGSTED
ncbi:hypothetical protein PUNSTDRAFT_44933 [Punctularia strigosozonata HHB-11173 SS5]|uniref:uncharacterized protein n=1 Tax=Punctularia strigosozonata (strain HHB-11173) TaxID=741275 RepID=UPI000441776B|nr:uncharacterized protein PUNSTDRAFT_44933 [Punctularia strigosozonata HHB-11173 SS5]EIN08430.1 hypothetical protein PUNSTDRAFT_44933 [Punctularia strigosozonata HHB-11173 SS5]